MYIIVYSCCCLRAAVYRNLLALRDESRAKWCVNFKRLNRHYILRVYGARRKNTSADHDNKQLHFARVKGGVRFNVLLYYTLCIYTHACTVTAKLGFCGRLTGQSLGLDRPTVYMVF